MKDGTIPEELRKHEIAQCVTIVKGGGDLSKISGRPLVMANKIPAWPN